MPRLIFVNFGWSLANLLIHFDNWMPATLLLPPWNYKTSLQTTTSIITNQLQWILFVIYLDCQYSALEPVVKLLMCSVEGPSSFSLQKSKYETKTIIFVRFPTSSWKGRWGRRPRELWWRWEEPIPSKSNSKTAFAASFISFFMKYSQIF